LEALRSEIQSVLRLAVIRPPVAPVVREHVREQDFTRKLISYVAPDGEVIEAFLFEPLSGSRAGVVALHQHNSDWSVGKSEVAALAGDPLQGFGPALARRGLSVLAPDALGFESRRGTAGAGAHVPPPPLGDPFRKADWLQYYNHAMHRLVRGELLMTKLLDDVAAAVSVLQGVVPDRAVGVVGHSFGGNLALFAGALDTRLSFTVSSGAVCYYRHKLAHGTGLEMALVIPGFSARFDFDDLLRCVAPRKAFVVSSEEDPLSADATEVVALAAPTFAAAGVAHHLVHLRTPGGHGLNRERFEAMVGWLSNL
jgi:dienelactone hydrolase